MLAHEVLRAAAVIVEAGWSVGAMARDGSGRPVALFKGDAKAGVNPEAVSFSLYGAICKAVHQAGSGRVERLALLWDVLYRHASNENGGAIGGTNHVHPVLQFNEQEGRTKEQVLALLDVAAQDCEAIGDGPFPPPVGVTPEQIAEAVA